MNQKSRPKHLNLMQIRLPLPGFVSILHRISGFGMFIMIGVLLGLLSLSVSSPEGFAQAVECLTGWFGKLISLGLVWAFTHHFIAGLRFLLLDIHVGTELASARKSSALVLLLSLALTVVIGVAIW